MRKRAFCYNHTHAHLWVHLEKNEKLHNHVYMYTFYSLAPLAMFVYIHLLRCVQAQVCICVFFEIT